MGILSSMLRRVDFRKAGNYFCSFLLLVLMFVGQCILVITEE